MRCFRHPLLPCLLAYVVGLWCGRTHFQGNIMAALLVLLPVALAAAVWTHRRRDATAVLLGVFILVGYGRLWLLSDERQAATHQIDSTDPALLVELAGRIAACDAESAETGPRFVLDDVKITTGSSQLRFPGRVLVHVISGNSLPNGLVPGIRVQLAAHLRRPGGFANFVNYDRAENLALERVYATATVSSTNLLRVVPSDSPLLRVHTTLATVRNRISTAIRQNMPPDDARLTNSMLFNDRGLMNDGEKRAFRDSGTMHLFAVSGMHVAILAMILLVLLRAMRLGHRSSWTVIIAVLFAYVMLLDFIAPAFRALLMILAYASTFWLRREPDPISAATFGTFTILLVDPLALWQAGFLLSIAGVLGIVLLVPLLREWITPSPRKRGFPLPDRIAGWLFEGLAVLIAVTVMVLPLQLYYFQQFNLLSPFANLVAAALSTPLLGGAVATAAASCWDAPAGLIGSATSVIMRALVHIARITAAADWAILRTPQIPAAAVLAYYTILASGCYLVRVDTPEFLSKSRARFCIAVAIGTLLLLGCSFWRPGSGLLRIWFLDVGQGDATFIQFPTGQNLLIDAGNIEPNVADIVIEPQLRALGITGIDNILATHADIDHVGGFPSLLRHFRVGALQIPSSFNNKEAASIQSVASTLDIPRQVLVAGAPLQLGPKTTVQVLNPEDAISSATPDNDVSIVLRIDHGDFSALLMGDAEGAVEERLAGSLRPCDVLKVGHHGSRHASNASFLSRVRPKLALISCGRRNRYRHPAPEVLDRLHAIDASILRTDVHGAVLLESDGTTFRTRTARGDWR